MCGGNGADRKEKLSPDAKARRDSVAEHAEAVTCVSWGEARVVGSLYGSLHTL